MSDSFLFNAGWLFFAAWAAVVAAVTVKAFGRDLLPWETHRDPAHYSSTDSIHPAQSNSR